MSDERLKQFLNQRAEQEIPDKMDLRESIHQTIQLGSSTRSSFRLRRTILVIALLLMTATAAYALYQTVIEPDPGIQAVQNEDLVLEINETHTLEPAAESYVEGVNDVNVTLDYAYADANRITIAYSVAAQVEPDVALDLYANPTLTDSAGQQYRWLISGGQHVLDNTSSTASGIMSFDASSITEAPETLDLTLQIEVAYATADMRASDPYSMILGGKTSFSFSLPFNPGQIVAVDQSATASELAVEVKQIVIAPSLTRFDICYDPTNLAGDAWLSWEAIVSLSVDGESIIDHESAGIEGFTEPDAPCRALTIPASLVNHAGTWTLTIHEFHNIDTDESVSGDWTYIFDVE